MIRRLTSLVAAIALVYAMAAPPAAACESAHTATTDAATAMAGAAHSMHGATTESDCPESEAPTRQDHDSNCLVTCLSMVGCSSPCFVAEAAMLSVIDRASQVAVKTMLLPSGRSSAPDRPPPRL